MKNHVCVSVIVPVYNSSQTLEKCLAAICKSTIDFQLVVVDDGSTDTSVEIAQEYAHDVIAFPKNQGRSEARNAGVAAAKSNILVFIDSDVVVFPDSLSQILNHFEENPQTAAVTGLLSKQHPHSNFFSQYKNLYMNYIFSKLPDKVNFLYGSIHALRKEHFRSYGRDVEIADDTALGQELSKEGKTIVFLRDLEVVHLKKYTFRSFIKNDFQIPYDWAKLFIKYQGWKQVAKKGGYAHSPKEQLLSLMLAPIVLLSTATVFITPYVLVVISAIWLLLNYKFVLFLTRHKGFVFGFAALATTFLDNLVMLSGIASGFLIHPWKLMGEKQIQENAKL